MKNKKIKSNKKPFFRFVKNVVKIFKKKPKITIKKNISQKASIYVANHAASYGPTTYELYLPTNFQMMGAYPMCGTLKQRWKYLYQVYFYQKRKVPKWLSSILATLVVPFMVGFYKGMQIVPIYNGMKFKKTIELSIEILNKEISLLIFPEDSSDGYHEKLTKFFGGFWMIAKEYHNQTGEDIDIIPMYYHKKLGKMIIDKPYSYLELSKELTDNKLAADFFLDKVNSLLEEIKNTY